MNLHSPEFQRSLWKCWDAAIRKSPKQFAKERRRRFLEGLGWSFVGCVILTGLIIGLTFFAGVPKNTALADAKLFLHGIAYVSALCLLFLVLILMGHGVDTGTLRCPIGLPKLRRLGSHMLPSVLLVFATLSMLAGGFLAFRLDGTPAGIAAGGASGILLVLAGALPGLWLASVSIGFPRAEAPLRRQQPHRRRRMNQPMRPTNAPSFLAGVVVVILMLSFFALLVAPLYGLSDPEWRPWSLALLSMLPTDWVVSGFVAFLENGGLSGAWHVAKLVVLMAAAPFWWARIHDRLRFDDLIKDEERTTTETEAESDWRDFRNGAAWRERGFWSWLCRVYRPSQLGYLDGAQDSIRNDRWYWAALAALPLLLLIGPQFGRWGSSTTILLTAGLALLTMLMPAVAAAAVANRIGLVQAGRLGGSTREIANTAVHFGYRLCALSLPVHVFCAVVVASDFSEFISWWHVMMFTFPTSFLIVPCGPGIRLLETSGLVKDTPRDWVKGIALFLFSLSPLALSAAQTPENLGAMFAVLFLSFGLVGRTWFLLGQWAADR